VLAGTLVWTTAATHVLPRTTRKTTHKGLGLQREHRRSPTTPNDDKYADMLPLMDIVGMHTNDLFVRDPFSRMTMLVPGLTELIQGINNS
jgi:hypothetical protein